MNVYIHSIKIHQAKENCFTEALDRNEIRMLRHLDTYLT
jgi:hypothetical protein